MKWLLFDLGGILLQLTGVPTMLSWTAGRFSEPELWDIWLHSKAVQAFESGRIGPEEFAGELIRDFSIKGISTETVLEEFPRWVDGFFPGAVDLLAQARSKYRTACLSNTNVLHWQRAENEWGIRSHFEVCFPSFEVGLVKPQPEIFQYVMDHLPDSPRPEEILFFDDHPENVAAARGLGLQAEHAADFDALTGLLMNRLG